MTFLETGVARAGMKATAQGLAWSSMWTVVRVDLGREPNFYEVAAWWNLSKAQAYRYQQAYRKCWPPHAASPWILTQHSLDQGLTTMRRLKTFTRVARVFKGIGMNEPQRDALVDEYVRLCGLAAA